MDTQLTITKDNFESNAAALGMVSDSGSSGKKSTLSRLRIFNQGVKVKQNNKNVEVVPAGYFRVQTPDENEYYAEKVVLRPFFQRFMLKMWDTSKKSFCKTIMSNDLNIDLKDTFGGFNCGKPSGYIKDFNALPDTMKDKIRQIKRVRAIFGEVELINPIDSNGENAELAKYSVIWEVDNREAFKRMGEPFKSFMSKKQYPFFFNIELASEEMDLPTGGSYFLPIPTLNPKPTITELTDEDQATLTDFMEWVANYNKYVFSEWDKNSSGSSFDEQADEIVDQFIDVKDES